MEVRFNDPDLDRLEVESDLQTSYAPEAVRGFRKVMAVIRAALDERDLHAMRSLNFEKLKGNRAHQCSLRLNKQWRLIVEVLPAKPKNVIVVMGIEDYH
jgi:toxin HigB-1